ncbi:unnamed protein product [Lepidochelys kempii]
MGAKPPVFPHPPPQSLQRVRSVQPPPGLGTPPCQGSGRQDSTRPIKCPSPPRARLRAGAFFIQANHSSGCVHLTSSSLPSVPQFPICKMGPRPPAVLCQALCGLTLISANGLCYDLL